MPTISQTIKRYQFSLPNPKIMAEQTIMPNIGTKGTNGVLNGRTKSGSLYLNKMIPIQTKTKANKVPMLVISPTISPGIKAANKPTNKKRI